MGSSSVGRDKNSSRLAIRWERSGADSLCRISGRDGVDDRPVLEPRARDRIMAERIIADGLRLAQNHAVPIGDQPVLAKADEKLVELAIEPDRLGESILGLLLRVGELLAEDGAQLLDELSGRAAVVEPGADGVEFEQHPRFVDLDDIGKREAADRRGAARGAFDEAVLLQPGERFLDRGLADRQRIGEFVGEQSLPRRQLPRNDLRLQFLIGLFGECRSGQGCHAARVAEVT